MDFIRLFGVKQNNLKDIDVEIPVGKFTVICGPSGSGKSSLAFESLYGEGQRRYVESLSNYARQFLQTAPKPDVDRVENIPPAIALQQKNHVKNSRSTVGTTTEILDYLRLLYAKIGKAKCPTHNVPIESDNLNTATEKVFKKFTGKRVYFLCPVGDKLKPKEALAQLLQDGYGRLYDKDTKEIIEITPKTKLSKEGFYILVDRLAVEEDSRGRITDSLRTCYEAYQKYNHEIFGRAYIISTEGEDLKVDEKFACAICGFSIPTISPAFFSFASPVGACTACNGFGNTLEIDPRKVIPNDKLSLSKGAISIFHMPSTTDEKTQLKKFAAKNGIDMNTPWNLLDESHKEWLWSGKGDYGGVKGYFDYLETKKYKMHVRIFLARYKSPSLCQVCHGTRLKPEVRAVTIMGKAIDEICEYNLKDLFAFIKTILLSPAEKKISSEVLKQLHSRLSFLLRVGVEYLTLSRPTRTLSGGEYQRIHLATQLGMGLSQVLYVLDEPTIGLHPRDNLRLIEILHELKDLGNSLVVVEHDHDVIHSADYIIEMGPGSGSQGGTIVFKGDKDTFLKDPNSLTSKYILNDTTVKIQPPNRVLPMDENRYIELYGCSGHNLKNIDVKIPLNRLVVITGVSGSGKSSLITQTLYPLVARTLGVDFIENLPCKNFFGADTLKSVNLIDQRSVGKNARSNPVTYMGAYDEIRKLYSETKESKRRGYKPGTFSLNVDGGRCPTCRGEGYETIEMQFLDDVKILCDECKGKRFKSEVLEITFEGKNIFNILSMTVEEAIHFFTAIPNIRKPLQYLREVGLGYIQLGQASSSLSGGETQRLKLAKEFSTSSHQGCLYILDEPTTGLHFREIELLLKILNQLVESGASVIVIEHNLDIIKHADYIVDLGPEGGSDGGDLLYQGNLQNFIGHTSSHTAKFLKS
jgi:excinuclease ABC subunit A